MTDEQINAAIAEACGWKNLRRHPMKQNVWVGENAGRFAGVLDYCTDLNAMHEAEGFLRGNDFQRYAEMLDSIIGSLGGIRATARERAEAFLRVLGKWEEVQP